MNKKKITTITLITSVLMVAGLAVFGLIYNQKVLQEYGSAVSGLISTLIQFVSLFTVIEGGFTTAALVSLYRPVVDDNYDEVNSILLTLKRYLNRLGIVIFLASLVLGVVFLFFIDSPLEWYQTIALLFVTVSKTSLSVAFQSRYSVVFNGLNKQYILNLVYLITKTICFAGAILLIIGHVNIVFVYLVYTTNVFLNVVFSIFFSKKKLKKITFIGEYDKTKIQGTKDVFIQKVASTVFTSTDLVLISAGVGLSSASVYNVYHQIFNMVGTLQSSVAESPFNSFGHLINENHERFKKMFSIYVFGIVMATNILLTSVGGVIVDFVHLYTKGVDDINYIVPIVSLLFYSQFFLTICNKPFGQALNLEKKFKEQNFQCILGAVINLVVSIIGMLFFGIAGIIAGSICGVLVIFAFNLVKCIRNGNVENVLSTLALLIGNFLAGIAFICIRLYIIDFFSENYLTWFVYSLITFSLTSIALILLNFLISPRKFIDLIKTLILRVKNRKKTNKPDINL